MRLEEVEARRRFAAASVARLATVGEDGRPHLVPVAFAAMGETIVTAVDAKPKRSRDLKRLRNIRANPRVSMLVDHYADDWEGLWWVRVDGHARVVVDRDEWAEPLRLLVAKYSQYHDRAPGGPVIEVDVERWVGWTAS